MDEAQLPQNYRLLFTTKFPEISCPHLIDLGKIKG